MDSKEEDYVTLNETSRLQDDTNKSIQIFIQNKNEKPDSVLKYSALIKRKEIQKPLLSTFDTVLSLLLLSPCVVGFWRGTWNLQDIYTKLFPSWFCLAVGLLIYLLCVIIQDSFVDVVKKTNANTRIKVFNFVITRAYTYIFAITSTMYWRGGWAFIDLLLGVEINAKGAVVEKGSGLLVTSTVASLVVLIVLRSLRNCVAPPFVFCTDRKSNTFIIPTRFRTKMNERASLYILDCLFSVLIIGTLVVFVWRGAWALVDIYLFPEDEIWSAWGSLVVGYTAVAIAFMLQPFMRWLCDRITGVSRVLVADLFLILSLIGTVNVWRGIWNLLNLYLLPDNLELSCWISHWICLIILILLGCSNSLLVRGVYIDAEEPAGKCVVFPCYYLRLIFQEQKLKKLNSDQNKTELVTVKPCENNHVISVQNASEQCPQTLDINHKECDV